MDDGADIRGYFQWTLTDNFEWNCGYRDRFGLVYVDFVTQRRYRKDSSYWYEKLIRTNGASLQEEKRVQFLENVSGSGIRWEVKESLRTRIRDEHILRVVEGYGTIHGICVRPGDCLKLENNFGEVEISGDMILELLGESR